MALADLQTFVRLVHHGQCQAAQRAHPVADCRTLGIRRASRGAEFDAVEQAYRLLLSACQSQCTGMHECERGFRLNKLGGQGVEPAAEQAEPALEQYVFRVSLQELNRVPEVT